MQDFAIVNMLKSQTNLGKPIQNLILWELLSILVLNYLSQVTSISILHDDAEFPLGRNVHISELDDVGMLQLL